MGTVYEILEYRYDSVQIRDGLHLLRIPLWGPVSPVSSAADYLGCIVIESGRDLAVIDPGLPHHPARYIVPFLESLGRESKGISLIVNTHEHFDHVLGNAPLKELSSADVAAHESAVGAIEGGVDRPLREGDAITVGDFDFQVLHTPGHSGACICLWEPRQRVLITGDTVQGNGHLVQGLALITDIDSYRESLERILKLKAEYMIPAHMYRGQKGPVLSGRDIDEFVSSSIHHSVDYEEEIEKVLRDVEQPLSRSELHAKLLERLTLDPGELKMFYLSFLGAWSRATIEAYVRQKVPENLRARITDEGWVDVGSLYGDDV